MVHNILSQESLVTHRQAAKVVRDRRDPMTARFDAPHPFVSRLANFAPAAKLTPVAAWVNAGRRRDPECPLRCRICWVATSGADRAWSAMPTPLFS